MEITGLIPHIEALIFASDKPLSVLEITDLLNNAFGFMEDKIPLDQIEAAMEGIVEKYASEFYPFEMVQSGGGWQFLTKKQYHKTVAQINGEKFMKRLSAAALETLAIIAYKQPVTKGEIEAIRGVSADYAVQKLLEKDLIVISGRNEKLPGHPLVYATSKTFMDYFGINSADELPKIKEVLAEHLVEPTVMGNMDDEAKEMIEEIVDERQLSVTENGELVTIQNVPVAQQQDGTGESNEIQPEVAEKEEESEGNEAREEEAVDSGNPADDISEPGFLDDELKQVREENPGNEQQDEKNKDGAAEEDKENY